MAKELVFIMLLKQKSYFSKTINFIIYNFLFISWEFHSFKSFTIASPKMTVTLSYFFTCCWVFVKAVNYWICWFFSCVRTISFTRVGFLWLDRPRWFYIIPHITLVSDKNFDSYWYRLDAGIYLLFAEWSLELLKYLFGTLIRYRRSLLCCHFQVMSVRCNLWFYFCRVKGVRYRFSHAMGHNDANKMTSSPPTIVSFNQNFFILRNLTAKWEGGY